VRKRIHFNCKDATLICRLNCLLTQVVLGLIYIGEVLRESMGKNVRDYTGLINTSDFSGRVRIELVS
jgi:hypothetical protein